MPRRSRTLRAAVSLARMSRSIERLLVTGGYGFIGANFVRRWNAGHAGPIVNLDALTYAGDRRRLGDLDGTACRSVEGDVCDQDGLRALLGEVRPDAVVHFAAESHVTRSESAAEVFRRTNVEGTRALLDALLEHPPSIVVHVSTDEVYGPCPGEPFREDQKEPGEGRATSPYARSKALADDLARSYAGRLPVVVARPTNCFGPWQHPEKALPRWVTRALRGLQLPVWGDGGYVRDWLPVGDACEAIALLLERGEPGGVYNIGPNREPAITNVELARWIVGHLGLAEDDVVLTAYDRPDHDRRYAVDPSRMRAFGWTPPADVWARFAETIAWYRDNAWWWETLVEGAESIYADRAELQDTTR